MSDSQAPDHDSVERGRARERVLERFEEAWVTGSAPDIRAFLGDASTDDGRGLITELIQVDLERRWRSSSAELVDGSGNDFAMRPRVEDYLSIADLTDLPRGPLLELLRAEFQVRRQWGDRPNVQEFLHRFPKHSEAIAESFQVVLDNTSLDDNDVEDTPADVVQKEEGKPVSDTQPTSEAASDVSTKSELEVRIDTGASDSDTAPSAVEPGAERAEVKSDDTDQETHFESKQEASGYIDDSTRTHRPAKRKPGQSSIPNVVVTARDIRFMRPGAKPAEYEIGEQLGEGGMGTVYQARQGSLNRTVAIKMVKPKRNVRPDQFLTEAIITGALEHPNIVPIYDMGMSNDGVLFYAMKEVRGETWSENIDTQTENEMLSVLLSVSDALGFAHSRGITHRDLKPSNIMLGEFGEVMVMDWGFALPTDDFAQEGLMPLGGSAGTPSYMAPEMAQGPITGIGPTSDTYLMGAMLFRALTGEPPHTGKNQSARMRAAADNIIVDVERDDELMAIARKSMATDPEERYQTAREFSSAIKEYQSHAESRQLADGAVSLIETGRATGDYQDFEYAVNRGIVLLKEALNVWNGNDRARDYLQSIHFEFATAAFEQEELELAASHLSPEVPEQSELLSRVRLAIEERDSRKQRLQRMKRIAAALAVVFVVTVSLSAVLINQARVAENHARVAEALAKDEALYLLAQAQKVIERLTGVTDSLKYYPRIQRVRLNLLDMVAEYYGELAERPGISLDLQLDLVGSLIRQGDVHMLRGDSYAAAASFSNAQSQCASLRQQHPTNLEVPQLQALAWRGHGVALIDRGEYDSGEVLLRNAINYYDSLSSSSPAGHADVLFDLARSHQIQGQHADAIDTLDLARMLYSKQIAEDTNPQLKVGLATTLSTLGQLYELRGETDQATEKIRQAIDIWQGLWEQQADNPDYLEGLAVSFIDLGNVQRAHGINPESAYTDGITAYQLLLEARPEIPRYRFNLATAVVDLALASNKAASSDEVVTLAVNGLDEFIRLFNEYPDESSVSGSEHYGRLVLAEILRDRADAENALEYVQLAIELLIEHIEEQDLPSHHERLAIALSIRAGIEASNGSLAESRDTFEVAIEILDQLLAREDVQPRWKNAAAWIRFHLAVLLWDNDMWENDERDLATQRLTQATTLQASISAAAPPMLQDAAWILLQSPDLALRDLKSALALMIQATQAVPDNAMFRRTLALAYLRSGDTVKCRAALNAAEAADESDSAEQHFLEALLAASTNALDRARELYDAGVVRMKETSPGRPRLIRLRDEAAQALGIDVTPETPSDSDSQPEPESSN